MTKKILLIYVLTTLVFSSFVFPQKQAEAAGGVSSFVSKVMTKFGINAVVKKVASGVNETSVPVNDRAAGIEAGLQEGETAFTEVLKALFKMFLETLRKRMLNYITNQIVNWIQGGGEPRFVGNWKDFLLGESSNGRTDTIKEIAADLICPEFVDALQTNFNVHFSNSNNRVTDFAARLACSKITGGTPISIEPYNDELSFLEPQNSYYGALGMIQDEMTNRAAQYAQAAQNEALAGGGFLSQKKCMEWEIPGDQTSPCIRETIITPGQTIGSLVSKAVGSDIDYIIRADELEQFVSAIANALINRLTTEGLGLLGESTSNVRYNNYGCSGVECHNDTELQTIDTSAGNVSGTSIGTMDQESLDQIINAYQEAVNELTATLTIKQQTLSVAQEIVTTLTNCYGSTTIANASTILANAEVVRIQQDINTLESLINEINPLSAEAQTLKQEIKDDPPRNEQEIEQIDQKIEDMSQKFNDFMQQNVSSIYSGKKLAQEELTSKQTELSDTQRTCSYTGGSI